MTNFTQLAQEYLKEAEDLKQHIQKLKQALKTATCNETHELNRRIAILYAMYLECRHTGTALQSHPALLREQQEQQQEQEEQWQEALQHAE